MSRLGKSFLGSLVFACAALTASTSAQVVINEIHYNPGSTGSLPNAEFVELYNTSASSVSLSGWSITDAFTINFSGATSIPGHGFLVLCKDPTALQAATGYPGAGQPAPVQRNVAAGAAGQLSDGGELITLRNAALATIDLVNYDDIAPWPTTPDGTGPSLELKNPVLDNSSAASWAASTGNHGTPGAQNSVFTSAATVQSESPARRTAVASLPSVSLTFSASVTGVTAGNLTVGGSPATTLSCPSCVGGAGAGPYVFSGYAAPARVVRSPGAGRNVRRPMDSRGHRTDQIHTTRSPGRGRGFLVYNAGDPRSMGVDFHRRYRAVFSDVPSAATSFLPRSPRWCKPGRYAGSIHGPRKPTAENGRDLGHGGERHRFSSLRDMGVANPSDRRPSADDQSR
jgi:hypothetical protein